jgi:hypothetical protein
LDKDARDGKDGKDGPYIGDILTRALFVEIFLEGENTHEAKCAAVARATKLSTRMSAALAKVPAREHIRAIHNLVANRVTSKFLDRCVAVMHRGQRRGPVLHSHSFCRKYYDVISRIREDVRNGLPGCAFWKTPGEHAVAVVTLRAALGGGAVLLEGYAGYAAIVAALHNKPHLKKDAGILALLRATYLGDRRDFMQM